MLHDDKHSKQNKTLVHTQLKLGDGHIIFNGTLICDKINYFCPLYWTYFGHVNIWSNYIKPTV